jgi:hypothetical protein
MGNPGQSNRAIRSGVLTRGRRPFRAGDPARRATEPHPWSWGGAGSSFRRPLRLMREPGRSRLFFRFWSRPISRRAKWNCNSRAKALGQSKIGFASWMVVRSCRQCRSYGLRAGLETSGQDHFYKLCSCKTVVSLLSTPYRFATPEGHKKKRRSHRTPGGDAAIEDRRSL